MKSTIENQKNSPFPAFTVCPEPTGYKNDILLKHGIGDNYFKGKVNWKSNETGITGSELFDLVTYSLNEIVDNKLWIRSLLDDVR